MAYDNTQEKRGHLHGTSKNPTKRAGRPDGQGAGGVAGSGKHQTSTHYPHENQPNPGEKGGGTDHAPEAKGLARGFVHNEGAMSHSIKDGNARPGGGSRLQSVSKGD